MAAFETVIIGAGPYGLSIAAHLRSANIGHVILGRPMESWRQHMPAGMVLKSEPFASNLSDPARRYTFEQYCASRGTAYSRIGAPLSIADFTAYANWFQHQAVPEIWDTTVRDLRWNGNAFALTLDDRAIEARRVIVATGHLAFRHVPSVLMPHARGAGALVSHSADHRDLTKFSGRDVTVIGCGQSGLETAALLHELGATVRLLARASAMDWNPDVDRRRSSFERIRWPESALGPGWRSLFYAELPQLFFRLPAEKRRRLVASAHAPAGAWWLKPRVMGKVPLSTSRHLVAATECNGRLDLTVRDDRGTTQIATDHVIAATGYRVDLDRLPFLDASLRATIETVEGAPVLNSVFESSVPGLHFVGLASTPSFGPVMRFVYGTRATAGILTAHIRGAARRLPKSATTAIGARSAAR